MVSAHLNNCCGMRCVLYPVICYCFFSWERMMLLLLLCVLCFLLDDFQKSHIQCKSWSRKLLRIEFSCGDTSSHFPHCYSTLQWYCGSCNCLIDQQEREAKLQYHSEKLALAFALLNTPPGATIRIKKNIRMCGDCHSAIKFVSMVMEREIVIRDTNRFHHFSNGFCSCGDYW